ncbi:heavy metal transport/detoxification superfamily protein [Wolffia australiana]
MASSISALQSPLSCRVCRRSSSAGLQSRSSFAIPLLNSQKRGFPSLEKRGIRIGAVAEEAAEAEQPVSVPVSPSDVLTMFFKAEGTMEESAIGNVTSNLVGLEGVSDLKVRVLEGIASVELAKQTTVQATGVASNLVEIIQGSGFKLQTLHLSFEDEEDAV